MEGHDSHKTDCLFPFNVLQPTWPEYFHLVDRLLSKIDNDFEPDFVVGLTTGGVFPAVAIAKYFRVPMAAMAAKRYYKGKDGQYDIQGKIQIGSRLAVVGPDISGRILLVDDMTDSGKTLQYCLEWLQERYGNSISEIRSAVIWHKTKSIIVPEYYTVAVETQEDGEYPWIIQPIEVYETMRESK